MLVYFMNGLMMACTSQKTHKHLNKFNVHTIIYGTEMNNKFTMNISTASYTNILASPKTDTLTILLSLLHTKIPVSDSSHQ
jgi:hypothetical protein